MRTHLVAIFSVSALLVALATPGCGSSSSRATPDDAPREARVRAADAQRAEAVAEPNFQVGSPRRIIRPLDPVVWAMPGVRLVAPVEVPDGRRVPERVTLRAKDGSTFEGRIVRIDVALAGESAPPSLAGGWLPEPGLWSVRRPSDARPASGLGQLALVADLPPEARGGPIWVERNRFDLVWLKPVSDAPRAALESPLSSARRKSRVLAELARAELRSPLRRWRYRLVVGRLGSAPISPPSDAEVGVARAGGRFDDVVIESMARQREAMWRRGLADLHAVDAGLCAQLRARLAATMFLPATPRLSPVGFREDTIVPAWPTDQADLDALLIDLLSAEITPGERRLRVLAWLGAQPAGMGWVVADAATIGAPPVRGPSPLFARTILANLTGEALVGSVAASGASGTAQMDAPPPREARVLDVPLPTRRPSATIAMRLGEWAASETVVARPGVVTPPGWNISGFFEDWTLGTCLDGNVRALTPSGDRATAALLYRDTDTPFDDDARQGWWLHVECERRPGDADDAVRLWFGPMGLELGAIEIRADGEVGAPEGAKSIVAWDASRVRVESGPREWTATAPIPPVLIGDDGVLLLGVERLNAGGRQAWPRPMLPWQTEPGRAAADLSTWNRPN